MGGGISRNRTKSRTNPIENVIHPPINIMSHPIIEAEPKVNPKQSNHDITIPGTNRSTLVTILPHSPIKLDTEQSSSYHNHHNRQQPYNQLHHDDDQYDEKESDIDDDEDEFAERSAEMFQNTAMSLGMDNDELLFNMMYFGGDSASSFDNMVNHALEETVALHSDNNTPYKLKPASDHDLAHLKAMVCDHELDEHDGECAICRDMIIIGDMYISLQRCGHCYHDECLMRWLTLQDWCPTCRHPIHDKIQAQHHSMKIIPSCETIGEGLCEGSCDTADSYDEHPSYDNIPSSNIAQTLVDTSIHAFLQKHTHID